MIYQEQLKNRRRAVCESQNDNTKVLSFLKKIPPKKQKKKKKANLFYVSLLYYLCPVVLTLAVHLYPEDLTNVKSEFFFQHGALKEHSWCSTILHSRIIIIMNFCFYTKLWPEIHASLLCQQDHCSPKTIKWKKLIIVEDMKLFTACSANINLARSAVQTSLACWYFLYHVSIAF